MHSLKDIIVSFPTIQDIVEIHSDSSETGHSQEYDDDWTTFVCRIGTLCYQISFHWHTDARKCSSNSASYTKKEVITEESYQAFANQYRGQAISNDRIKEVQDKLQEREEIKQKLEKLTPLCPKCGSKMEFRRNSTSQTLFWGCPRYQKRTCNGTKSIAESYLNLMKKLNSLP